MALKGFENVKKKNEENKFKVSYDNVELKIKSGNPNIGLKELREWFIYGTEQYYNTVMLGTNVHYCYSTFTKLKGKYNLCNFELAKQLTVWRTRYHQLGYGTKEQVFDFGCMNTEWLMNNLNTNTPNGNKKEVTYKIQDTSSISTKDRRI